MKGLSPTQRTLKELRNRGMLADIVERFNRFAGPHGKLFDAFGFIDLIALDPARGKIVAVQCCGKTGFADHHTKIVEECFDAALQWIQCGGVIELWAWRKVKLHRGSKAERWAPRIGVYDSEAVLRMNAGIAPEEESER